MLLEHGVYTKSCTNQPSWAKTNARAIGDFTMDIYMWVLNDAFLQMKREYGGWLDVSSSSEEFHLLNRHPILCGILSFYIILSLYYIGVALAEGWGIMSMAHLYNTMRQQQNSPSKFGVTWIL